MDSSRPSALPDWSAVPSNSEEDRKLLNGRLAYFGAVTGIISGGFYLVVLAVSAALGRSLLDTIRRPDNVFHLGATLLFASEWLLCRSARRSSTELNAIDVGATFGALSLFAVDLSSSTQGARGSEPALVMTLITLSGLMTRAVIVPGTARRTLWVSAFGCVPSLVAAYRIATRAPQTLAGMDWTPATDTIYVAAWGVVAVAIATLTSRVIYGLSQRVRLATELGQYTLEEKIGEGGMGVVYRARHALLRRPTALKVLPRELAGERSILRFEREVQLTSALTHPNTIAIYDYGRSPDGLFYYVMEYLDGITLEELVTHDGPQPFGRVVHLLKQLCSALQEAHEVKLIHRDVKPANIVLCVRGGLADYVKVLDFGLVKETVQGAPELSTARAVVGTPKYLAPEALTAPDRVDASVDLYAVGGVGYELLTGAAVFDGATIVEVCAKILHEAPVSPSERRGTPVPPALEALILSCLSKDPSARPASAAEIVDALEAQAELEPWSPVDARRWWSERAPTVLAAAKAARLRDQTSAGRQTMAIDLMERDPTLHPSAN
jgi:serine/threonine-protein kinase